MAFGSWIKKIGKKIKGFANDFANCFKHGWNKTLSVVEKIPVVKQVSKIIPKFNNSNNPVTQHFGGDGYTKFDNNGNEQKEPVFKLAVEKPKVDWFKINLK